MIREAMVWIQDDLWKFYSGWTGEAAHASVLSSLSDAISDSITAGRSEK